MKIQGPIILFFIFTSLFGNTQISKPDSSDIRALRFLKEVEWPKAYREQDTALLKKILADEFQMIGSEGEKSTKREQIEYLKHNKPDCSNFRFIIKRLDVFENNTAIVSGTGIIRRRDANGLYELTYQSSNVLIKRNGQWKAIASHTSGDKISRLSGN